MAYQQGGMQYPSRDMNYSQRDLNYPPREPPLREPPLPPRDTAYQQQPQHAYPSPNLSQRSQRSEHSHSQKSVRSRASMRSTNGMPDTESRSLEASHILDQLQKEIVFLTGGRDRQGGPLLIFPPHRDEYFQPNDITACLKYLYQIPSEESKRRGFTAIIDSRDGSWSNLVTVLGCLKQSLGEYLKQVLVLRTDGMGARQASSSSFRRDRGPNIEPQFINLNRLYTFVDRNQLIGSMSGTLMYHHKYWLQNRLDLEKFLREARAVASHLDTSESEIGFQQRNQGPDSPISPMEALRQHRFFQDSILSVPNQVLSQGQELLQKLQQYTDVAMRGEELVTTFDNLEAQKQVKRMLQYIENRVDKIRTYLENRDRSLNVEVQRDTVQREIRQWNNSLPEKKMERLRKVKSLTDEEPSALLAGLGLGAAFLGGAGLLAYGGYKFFESLKKEGQLSETGGNFNEWRKAEEQTSSKMRIAKTGLRFAKTEKSLAKTETSIDKTEMRQDKNKCDADEDLCKICLDKMANTVSTNCGHMVSCTSCCEQLRSCPICRKKANWIKVYKS